jgi:hypothetical protein
VLVSERPERGEDRRSSEESSSKTKNNSKPIIRVQLAPLAKIGD